MDVCNATYSKSKTQASLFWARVDKSGGDDACWLWTGYTIRDGYGRMCWEGRDQLAHRIAYQLEHGHIPDGLCVCHNCPQGDNPRCCNPSHLWLGTHKQNMRDMSLKKRVGVRTGDDHWSHQQPERVPRGENIGTAVLTDIQVAQLRRRYEVGDISLRELGLVFGISKAQARRIVRYESRRLTTGGIKCDI